MSESKALVLQLPPHLSARVEVLLKAQEKTLRKAAKDRKKLANKELERQVWGEKREGKNQRESTFIYITFFKQGKNY